ncbi:uncharacterized protein LOC126565431 [Anopheles maculipalpis]|uniref:uncharacterized protein LOC126565431 n=1 Tax=Anopheles maculipalpis TaxID=1496333 RepID=UPI002158CCB6|nr:uncharacterized protein LOC126565431 [Anopheles maculipalpis]
MSATPDRQNVPISRVKSPRTPTSPGNVASLRIEESISTIVEYHRKWIQAVDKGTLYCNAIKQIKKNAAQQQEPSSSDDPYPENLQLYCKNLMVMVSIMEDIEANALTSVDQVKSLKEFFFDCDTIGCTWNYRKILNAVERIIASYKKEILFRKYIAENIGHSQTLDQLFLFVTSWNHGADNARDRELLITMLKYEFQLPS